MRAAREVKLSQDKEVKRFFRSLLIIGLCAFVFIVVF